MTIPTPSIAHPRLDAVAPVAASAPAYEVMYLLDIGDDRVAGLRAALDAIGDSVVVSGGGGLWNVHVHTDEAGAAIDAGAAVGHAHRIRVTPLVGAALMTHQDDAHHAAHVVRLVLDDGSAIAVVRDALREAGVVDVDDGRPAVLLVDATSEPPRPAADVDAARVAVSTPVAALAAIAVHDPALSVVDDAAAMAAAAVAVRAVRVRPRAGSDAAAQSLEALRPLLDDDAELVTVVAEKEPAARIEELVRAEHPRLQVATVVVPAADIWLGVE